MPRDRFRAQRERAQWRTIYEREPSFLHLQLRKCPSCKQITVSIKKLESKVVVLCKNCFLEYVFTKYPAFEDIDYYNKMLDTFRQDVKDGRVTSAAVAAPENIVGQCPRCARGILAFRRSHSGRRFIRCSNNECHAVFSLPSKGDFEPAKETCKRCSWPLLFWEFRTLSGGFALFCFNRDCGYRSEWKGYAHKKV